MGPWFILLISLLYTGAGIAEMMEKTYVWGIVWLSYATAGYALLWIRVGGIQ